ncbi:MAG: hypothetical protein ACI9MF_001852 [Gammaproteobacteria bacterium]|jgi:hypothetical protein
MTIKGSCLCQAVKYEVRDAEFFPISNCHCENCRKAHSAAFGSYVAFKKADFRWIEGEELVTHYESSPLTYRCFCSRCGSPLAAFDNKEIRCITLGSTDGDPRLRPEFHIYVSSKAPWYEITDDLPQFELRSPETRPPVELSNK